MEAAAETAVGTARVPVTHRFTLSAPFTLQDLAFSVKTFAAGILALLISYWLEVKEPQWSLVTAYLLSQPMVGAILSKSAYRLAGTLCGAVFAVVCVGLFAQAGPLFILAMALWLAGCAYGATLSRNFTSYGFGLAAYSALLIGFGSVDTPNLAWIMASDRVTEVGLGILCAALVHITVFPRYAGDALFASVASTFSALARYAAIVLRPGTPDHVFLDMRRQMANDIVKFDALRSYAVFETPALRRDDEALSRTLRAFLGLMSVARGLQVRLTDLHRREDQVTASWLDPVLDRLANLLDTIAADSNGPRSPAVAASLDEARRAIGEARADLEALAGTAATDHLSEGLLVLQRTGDMVASLSRVTAAFTGSASTGPSPIGPSSTDSTSTSTYEELPGPRIVAAVEPDQKKALIQAARAATAVVMIGLYWIFSAWTAGATAMTGLAVMMVFFVTAENPAQMAVTFVGGVVLGMIVGFFGMAVVVPQAGDFVPLAAFLALVLIPAGILMTKPQYAFAATVFAAFFATQIGLANVPSFDIGSYVDRSIGLLTGLCAGVLAISLIVPYDPARPRRNQWAEVVAALPGAARGQRPEFGARLPILLALLKLMPRLDLSRRADDEIMSGSFGAASMSLELIRLRHRIDGPTFPADAAGPIGDCLDRLAQLFDRLTETDDSRILAQVIDEAAASVASTRAALADLPKEPGATPTIELAHAQVSLHFIADRFDFDRTFLTRTISAS